MAFPYPYTLADDPLEAGVRAAVGEQAEAARWQLWEAVTRQPRSEMAWLWLAKVAESESEEKQCLDQLATLDPARAARARPGKKAKLFGRRPARRPQAVGACDICERPWVDPPRICPRCRCLLDLGHAETFLSPPEHTNRKVVRQAVRRLELRASRGEDLHRALALAYLNLGELQEALDYLDAVVAESPDDSEAVLAADLLRANLAGIQMETGFETEIIERPSREELGLA